LPCHLPISSPPSSSSFLSATAASRQDQPRPSCASLSWPCLLPIHPRRRPTPAVLSPAWNNKIFFRFDFTDFALAYEELFGAPDPGPESELEVKEVVSSSGSSRFVHPILLPSSLGLVSYGVCFCFDNFISISNGGDYWDVRFPLCLEMRLLHVVVS
jgi:hypothetical protein